MEIKKGNVCMDKCLDTIRQKSKLQISITSYHTREKSNLLSKKILISSFLILNIFIVGGIFYFVTSNSGSIYAEKSSIKNNQELVARTNKVEAAQLAEIQAEEMRYTETIKRIEDQRVQLKAKKEKEVQIAQEIAAQVAASQSIITKYGGFDNIYIEAENKYGVSRYLIAAVHYVETGQSGDTQKTSYAGAQGPLQFMPNTFNAYAQDGDGDGQALINDVHDAVYTAAKYLSANGATTNNVNNALYRYNHSYVYVDNVLSIARSFGFKG